MDTTADSTTTTATSTSSGANNTDQFHHLRHLNKVSHKISKPTRRPPSFDNQAPVHAPPPQPESQPSGLQQQQQQQPPVYNINKNDFREVVQKLTGSPAHERFSTPPPIQQPKPQSSRLQRIRPPPLAQISNRPPPMLNCAVLPPQQSAANAVNPNNPISANAGGYQRPMAPLSPLPPFPAVHAAAESPISAYMRYLQTSVSTADSDPKRFQMGSPKWNSLTQSLPPPLPAQHQNIPPSPTSTQSPFLMPPSPLPFGCLPSPLFSPSGLSGFQPFPVSPRLPVPSPRWKDH